MAKTGWRGRAWRLLNLSGLLRELSSLDDLLDVLLLPSPRLSAAPPHWALVIAMQAEMLARFTSRSAFLALLPSQSTCKAT